MKLSIITINLNNKGGLLQTLQSIEHQTNQNFEYIVIDGASTDGSMDLICTNERINVYISEKDNGVYEAMNKGIKKAKGEYILFLNSGDTLYNNNTLLEAVLSLDRDDIIYGDLVFVEDKKSVVYNYPSNLTFNFLFTASLGHPATFIKRELFDLYGYYDISYRIIADWVFFAKVIVKENVSTKHIDQIISAFDTNGMSSDPKNQSFILDERKKFLKTEFPLFYDDYVQNIETQNILRRIKSCKAYKFLKKLGVKKFQY